MGILDLLSGNDPSTAPAPAPNPNGPQNVGDVRTLLQNLARTQLASHPLTADGGGLLGWITGANKAAADARAAAVAPDAFNSYSSANSDAIAKRVGLMQNLAAIQGMSGVKVNPNNPLASTDQYSSALTSFLNGGQAGGAQPPASAGSGPQPGAQNPVAQIDAVFGGKPVNPSIVQQFESNNDPNAVSPKGAVGLMQVQDATNFKPGFGVQSAQNNSPAERTRVGQQYLTALQQHYQSPTLGLIAYNWGPGNTDAWLKSGGNLSALPVETQRYVANIARASSAGGANAAPNVQSAPAGDPDAARRAMLLRLASMHSFMNDPAGFKTYYDAANLGRPEGTVPSANGTFTEPQVTTPNGAMPAQDYAAQGSEKTAAGTALGTATETPVPVMTRNGPGTVSQAQLLHGGGMTGADGQPNFLPTDSPQYKAIQERQQADMKTFNDAAGQANTSLDTAMQLYNAANGLFTGHGAGTLQGWRKSAVALSQLTGMKLNPDITNDTAKFEQLKYAALNFVQSAAHSFSPRAALQVIKMIQAAKPGDETSPQGIKAIITNQIMPAMLRAQNVARATQSYYQQNPLAQDATTAVPARVPLPSSGIKDIQHAQPGDYFVDPHSGNLRQRPVQ